MPPKTPNSGGNGKRSGSNGGKSRGGGNASCSKTELPTTTSAAKQTLVASMPASAEESVADGEGARAHVGVPEDGMPEKKGKEQHNDDHEGTRAKKESIVSNGSRAAAGFLEEEARVELEEEGDDMANKAESVEPLGSPIPHRRIRLRGPQEPGVPLATFPDVVTEMAVARNRRLEHQEGDTDDDAPPPPIDIGSSAATPSTAAFISHADITTPPSSPSPPHTQRHQGVRSIPVDTSIAVVQNHVEFTKCGGGPTLPKDKDSNNDVAGYEDVCVTGGPLGIGMQQTLQARLSADLSLQSDCSEGDDVCGSSALCTPSPSPAIMMRGVNVSLRHKHIKRVSNYLLGPIMGEGTYGVVRDAIDMSTPSSGRFQRVAIKCVVFKPLPNATMHTQRKMEKLLDIFENEVQILQRFHNPHVIRAADIFSRDGKEYIVLPIALCSLEQLVREVIRGETRASALAHYANPMGSPNSETSLAEPTPTSTNRTTSVHAYQTSSLLSSALVKGIMFQILTGVQYLHNQGIAHNDLKPANILLFADGAVKLTDLGSCGAEFKGHGTPAYLSPEVCRLYYHIEPEEDPRPKHGEAAMASQVAPHYAQPPPLNARKNDMWCCGIILYYLLAGRIPFNTADKRTEYQLLRDIVEKEINLDHIQELEVPEMPGSGNTLCGGMNRGIVESSNGCRSGGGDGARDGKGTIKHLLRHLLDRNPVTRYTAEQALQDPWLSMESTSFTVMTSDIEQVGAQKSYQPKHKDNTISTGTSNTDKYHRSTKEDTALAAAAVEDQVQHDVGRQVMRSREIQLLVKRDRERHLQFVAEVSHVLLIAVPPIVFRLNTACNNCPTQANNGAKLATALSTTRGTDKDEKAPNSRYCGSVDRTLFMDDRGQRHYERKGKPEYDVRSLRGNPARRLQMMAYLDVVLCENGVPGRRRDFSCGTGDCAPGYHNSVFDSQNGPLRNGTSGGNYGTTGGDPNGMRSGDELKEGSKCFCGLM